MNHPSTKHMQLLVVYSYSYSLGLVLPVHTSLAPLFLESSWWEVVLQSSAHHICALGHSRTVPCLKSNGMYLPRVILLCSSSSSGQLAWYIYQYVQPPCALTVDNTGYQQYCLYITSSISNYEFSDAISPSTFKKHISCFSHSRQVLVSMYRSISAQQSSTSGASTSLSRSCRSTSTTLAPCPCRSGCSPSASPISPSTPLCTARTMQGGGAFSSCSPGVAKSSSISVRRTLMPMLRCAANFVRFSVCHAQELLHATNMNCSVQHQKYAYHCYQPATRVLQQYSYLLCA